MSRSKWKSPYIKKENLVFSSKLKKNYQKALISRNSEILPKFIEKTFEVYNGKKYIEILVTEEMIGHRFGEFCSTKKQFSFKKKNKKNKK